MRTYTKPPSPRYGVPRQEPIEGAKLRKRRVVRNPAPQGIGQYMKPLAGTGMPSVSGAIPPQTGLGQARAKAKKKRG